MEHYTEWFMLEVNEIMLEVNEIIQTATWLSKFMKLLIKV